MIALLSGCSLTQPLIKETNVVLHTVEPIIHEADKVLLDIEQVIDNQSNKDN